MCINRYKTKIIKNRRGSLFVEGALFIPVMIIGMLCLVFLLKACWIEILFMSAAADHVTLCSVNSIDSYLSDISEEIAAAGLKKSDLKKTDKEKLNIADIEGFEKVSFMYDTDIPLPENFVNHIYLENTLVTRKWEGLSFEGGAFGFLEMCEEGYGSEVWLFPRDGERFHDIDCRYVRSYYEKVIYTLEVKNNYSPCPICIENEVGTGDEVYVFRHGNSYHSGDCSAVKRQVICMDRKDAEIKGYTACTVCGG